MNFPEPNPRSFAAGALQASAKLWYLTAVAGQWLFVLYIAGFYGPTVVTGHYELWARNRNLIDGYVAGDAVGNSFFAAHVMLAAVLTFGGALQLVPQIRDRVIAFHRWNGRLFMVAAISAASAGLYLQWVRGTAFHSRFAEALGTTLNGLLIFTFAGLAWRAVRRKDIDTHQRWATRLFLVVNGVWFLRVGFRAWMLVTHGAFGAQPFFTFWSFGSYLLPLAMYQWYLHAKERGRNAEQLAAAGSLVALALLMGAGAGVTFVRTWRPLLLM